MLHTALDQDMGPDFVASLEHVMQAMKLHGALAQAYPAKLQLSPLMLSILSPQLHTWLSLHKASQSTSWCVCYMLFAVSNCQEAGEHCLCPMQVNNAAIYPDEWDEPTFTRCLQTNVWAPVALIQALAPYMRPGSVIVNVTSSLGMRWVLLQDVLQTGQF
jgi:hypothetical protein